MAGLIPHFKNRKDRAPPGGECGGSIGGGRWSHLENLGDSSHSKCLDSICEQYRATESHRLRKIDAHDQMRSPIDLDYVIKAILGMGSPVLGVVTSFQEQIEWHLRIALLLVGMAVGLVSLVGMLRKMRGR
jgi:hypothetical protein